MLCFHKYDIHVCMISIYITTIHLQRYKEGVQQERIYYQRWQRVCIKQKEGENMTSLRHLDYMLSVVSARLYFKGYELPKTQETYKSLREHKGKNSHSFYAAINIEDKPFMVTLNISENLTVKAVVSTKLTLSEEQREKCETNMSELRRAMCDGVIVSFQSDKLKLSQTIWDRKESCDEDDLEPRIGFLLVTAATCINCLLRNDVERLTAERIISDIHFAKMRFSKDNLDEDNLKIKASDDDFDEDTLTLPIETATMNIIDDDNQVSAIMSEAPDFDSFIKRMREREQHEDPAEGKESTNKDWLDSTCFTPKEKEILTFFKNKLEERKEK